MKQKFTSLVALLCLLLACSGNVFGQILLMEGFEEANFPPTNTPYGSWTVSGYGNNLGACATLFLWEQVHSNALVCSGSSTLAVPAHGGSFTAGYNSKKLQAVPGSVSNLISPAIYFADSASSVSQYIVSFWMYGSTLPAAGTTTLSIFLTQNNTSLVPLSTPQNYQAVGSAAQAGWHQYTYIFPSSSIAGPGYYYVVFQATSGQDQDIFLDDINLTHYTPCTGHPNSSVLAPANICPNTPFYAIDTATAGLSGMQYQWQSRLAGTNNPFANIIPASSAIYYNGTGITSNMEYRVLSVCTNSSLSDTSLPHTTTVNSFYYCYCGPQVGSNLGGDPYPELDSVGISASTLHNATYGPLPNNYATYPASGNTTANLAQGTTYTISSLTNALGQKGAAWIDYYQNGFQGSDFINMSGSSASNLLSSTFTVPLVCSLGHTGLRVRVAAQAFGNADFCTTMLSGETEDYIVNIVPPSHNDVAATSVITPATGDLICSNTNLTVRVAITNYGTVTQHNNFQVFATWYGPNSTSGTINTTYTGYLAPFSTDTVNVGTISLPLSGDYYIVANTGLQNDENHGNDTTIGGTFIVSTTPPNPVVTSDTVCYGNAAHLSVQNVAGNVFNWYSAPSGGTSLLTGTTKNFASLTNNFTYFVAETVPTVPDTFAVPIALNGTTASHGGEYFDIVPSQDLTVDSFRLRFADTGLQLVRVYYQISQPPASILVPTVATQNLLSSVANWVQATSVLVHVTDVSSTPSSLYLVTLNTPIQVTFSQGIVYSIYLDYDAFTGPNPNVLPASSPVNNITGGKFYYGLTAGSSFANVSTKVSEFNGKVYYHLGGQACESQRVPVFAAIGPKPAVHLLDSNTICWTPQLYLNAGNQGGGAKFAWSKANSPFVSWTLQAQDTTQIYTIPLSDTGTHFYSVTVSHYCDSTATTKLTILPPPFATGIDYTAAGTTYYFSVSGTRDVTDYYWTFGDGGTSVLSSPVYTYSNNNPHNVRLVVYNICGSDTLNWIVPTLGVPGVASNSSAIELYPNPAGSSITINCPDNALIKDITIVNSVGEVVYRQQSNKVKSENIDVSRLPQGNYILRANTSDGYYNKLFNVMH